SPMLVPAIAIALRNLTDLCPSGLCSPPPKTRSTRRRSRVPEKSQGIVTLHSVGAETRCGRAFAGLNEDAMSRDATSSTRLYIQGVLHCEPPQKAAANLCGQNGVRTSSQELTKLSRETLPRCHQYQARALRR